MSRSLSRFDHVKLKQMARLKKVPLFPTHQFMQQSVSGAIGLYYRLSYRDLIGS